MIACTLSSHQAKDQLGRWEAMAARASARGVIDGGARLTFGRDLDLDALTELVVAEQNCCQFLTFTLTISSEVVALDITGPSDARLIIDALVGAAS